MHSSAATPHSNPKHKMSYRSIGYYCKEQINQSDIADIVDVDLVQKDSFENREPVCMYCNPQERAFIMMRQVYLPSIKGGRPSTYKSLGRGRLIGGRIIDALDGGGGGEGRLADGLLGGDAKGVNSGKECNNGKGSEAHGGNTRGQVRTGGTQPVGSLPGPAGSLALTSLNVSILLKRKINVRIHSSAFIGRLPALQYSSLRPPLALGSRSSSSLITC